MLDVTLALLDTTVYSPLVLALITASKKSSTSDGITFALNEH